MALEDLGTTAAFFNAISRPSEAKEAEENRAFQWALTDMEMKSRTEKMAQLTVLDDMLKTREARRQDLEVSRKNAMEVEKLFTAVSENPNSSSDMVQILQNSRDNELEWATQSLSKYDDINSMISNLTQQVKKTDQQLKHYDNINAEYAAGQKSGLGTSLAELSRQLDTGSTVEKFTVSRREASLALEELLKDPNLTPIERQKLANPAFKEGVLRNAMDVSAGLLEPALQEKGIAADERRTSAIQAQTEQDKLLKAGDILAIGNAKLGLLKSSIDQKYGVQYDQDGNIIPGSIKDQKAYDSDMLKAQKGTWDQVDKLLKQNYGNKYLNDIDSFDSLQEEKVELETAFGEGFEKKSVKDVVSGSVLDAIKKYNIQPIAGVMQGKEIVQKALRVSDLMANKSSVVSEINKAAANYGEKELTKDEGMALYDKTLGDLKEEKGELPTVDEVMASLKAALDNKDTAVSLLSQFRGMGKISKKIKPKVSF